MSAERRVAGDGGTPPWCSLPSTDVADEVGRQNLGARIALRTAREVQLAKQNHALAFAVFQQRAVVQAEAAVEDREKIAASRFFDQNRGHVAPIAATPHPGGSKIAPRN